MYKIKLHLHSWMSLHLILDKRIICECLFWMHLAGCINRDIRYLISKHGGVSCTVCTGEATVTWCVSSCFTLIFFLSFLLVGGLLTLFVYLIVTLKLFSYCQVNQRHREGSTKSARGTARTQSQQISEPFRQCDWQQTLKIMICLCVGWAQNWDFCTLQFSEPLPVLPRM